MKPELSENQELHNKFLNTLWGELSDEWQRIIRITSNNVKTGFYTSSWVNIEEWDSFSKVCGAVCKSSYSNSPFVEVDRLDEWWFRWPRWFRLVRLPEWCLETFAPDGIWTKVVLIETLWGFESAANDVVAMTADDIARNWWLPLVFTNVLDTRNIAERRWQYDQMMINLWRIAAKNKFVIFNWETAELSTCVGTPNIHAKTAFNWSGIMSWVYHKNKMILWNKVQAGNILVALKQDWFRSNWLSAVRKWFELKYWPNYYVTTPKEELREAASPSIIYSTGIAEANWWYSPWFQAPVKMTWIAHLSWGSFKWKLLEDMLWANKLSAVFDNLYPIPDIVKKVALRSQKWEKPMKSLEEMYSTWCCGQWMIVAVETQEDANKLIEILANNWIYAQIAGQVIATPEWEDPSVVIKNVR